jgi:hypothetical protein
MKILFISIGLVFIATFSFAQVNNEYDLRLDTLSGKETLSNEVKSKYLSSEFLHKVKADTSCIELYYRRERIAVMPYSYSHLINYKAFSTINYEVVNLKGNKKLLKVKMTIN